MNRLSETSGLHECNNIPCFIAHGSDGMQHKVRHATAMRAKHIHAVDATGSHDDIVGYHFTLGGRLCLLAEWQKPTRGTRWLQSCTTFCTSVGFHTACWMQRKRENFRDARERSSKNQTGERHTRCERTRSPICEVHSAFQCRNSLEFSTGNHGNQC